jgi:hypothetical protein
MNDERTDGRTTAAPPPRHHHHHGLHITTTTAHHVTTTTPTTSPPAERQPSTRPHACEPLLAGWLAGANGHVTSSSMMGSGLRRTDDLAPTT